MPAYLGESTVEHWNAMHAAFGNLGARLGARRHRLSPPKTGAALQTRQSPVVLTSHAVQSHLEYPGAQFQSVKIELALVVNERRQDDAAQASNQGKG
jgi:hypothetical protein